MHPELLDNPILARYYETWQRDPRSLVFAPLADFLCQRKLFADARKICEAGVRHNPDSVLAHYSLAKTYTYTREWHSARHEAQWVLAKIPDHQGAMAVLQQVEQSQSPVRHMVVTPAPIATAIEAAGGSAAPVILSETSAPPQNDKVAKKLPWQTVTMAKIYAQQGHHFKARTIYRALLSCDPQNREASRGLAALELQMSARPPK